LYVFRVFVTEDGPEIFFPDWKGRIGGIFKNRRIQTSSSGNFSAPPIKLM
jgi:hypothetical protein